MKTKLFTLGIILMMLCVVLTACLGNQPDTSVTTPKVTDPPVVKHTVTFLNGEDTYKTVEVVEGEAVSEPEAPAKEGTESTHFVFDGWYNGETKWDFANDKVNADVTLTARFTEEVNTYEVKILDVNGNVVSTETVAHGTKLTQPENPETPVEAGTTFTFDGWYNGEAKWDFENGEVTSDVSLKPVFASEKIDVIITFNMDDGTLIETVTVKYGETPNCSVTPAKADAEGKHYEFAGWDKTVAPATEAATYIATFKEYSVGIGNTDTFAADTIYKNVENKYINASYNYSSISGSYFPIVVNNEALVFNVFSTDDTGVLNIDFGSVKAGVTYYVSLNLVMKDADGNLLTDGFAYAFATVPDKTASDAALLTSYALLTVNGQNGFLITPTADVEHLYLSIRTQKAKGYMESTATIDNVCIKEVNLSGADISKGDVSEDFSDGIVVSEGNSTIWYGDVKVYSPNLNATVVSSDGKLLVSAEKSGQQGLAGFYIAGVKAGKSYEVSMDLKLYDADKVDATGSFSMMVYANGNFTGTRYNLYVGDTNLQITPTVDKVIDENGHVTFTFTSHADGYVIIALRANSAPLYAEIDNFYMKEVDTYAFITFNDENGNVIETVKYKAGEEIKLPEALTKESTETVAYTFAGWYNGTTKLEEGTTALYDTNYTATFTESARKYTVTYYNEDDTVYQTVEVAYGETFTLIEAPTSDGKVGTWVGDVYATMPAQDISYKLSYSVTSYTASITVNGEAYNNYTYTVENREAVRETILGLFANDAQYTYSYANVPSELPLEDCSYDIVRTVNQYTVKFVVDGEVKETLTLDYGATPTTTLAPTKDDYMFTGWTPAIATVTGDATYTAVFTANSLDVTETFESGSISNKNYTGSDLSGYIPNTNSSIALVEYNGSNALAVSKLGTVTSSGYFGMKVDVKPNTTYVVTLDLAAVGASTADLSTSSLILFEVYENANIGTNASRLSLFSNAGRWLNNNQKISSFLVSGTSYQVVFTTSDFDGESGYVYFTLRLNSTLAEDATVYLDNLRVNECVTTANESFDNVTEITDTVAKGANSTVTVENGALKATCTASKQGFLGVYVKVEAGKTYIVHFDATVTGADGTDYSAGTSGGSSATVMVFQNNSGFNNTYRVNYMASKANATVSNTPLPNVLNTAVPNYCLTFTATEDGYVYIALRTNNIAQESYITFDNLLVSELELD